MRFRHPLWLMVWSVGLAMFIMAYQANGEVQQRGQRDSDNLLRSTERVRAMDEATVIALVPLQSGLHYVDCPNCDRGRQENQLTWSIEHPDEVVCQFCQHRFPSSQYPMDRLVSVQTPLGRSASFPYWQNSQGYRHFFQAKRDDEVRVFLAQQARDLAQLYTLTGDEIYARRAAVIVDRFAEVFPNWCYHYDYPFRQKEIYDGPVDPKNFRPGYRTARWNWWAYRDIPTPLVQAYEGIRDSSALAKLSSERGIDVGARIEKDLIRNACEQVIANDDPLTNMSPSAWQGLIQAGKVLKEPKYVHEPVRRLKRFVDTQFFYDGFWCEGSPDYGSQSMGGLEQVVQALYGYSDPLNYKDPVDGTRFDNLDLTNEFAILKSARDGLAKMRLPNGRSVPVHDTWSTSQRGKTQETLPFLLPALGHACLGGGTGDRQTQLHLTWSGGYGHSHGDNLSMLLYAHGGEVLSDLGYTHTAYRSWTLATAAHNTVVIDGKNQELGGRSPTDGNLKFFDAANSRIQVVSATGQRGYRDLALEYQRTMMTIDGGDDYRYVVDLFEVEGGQTHDYFFHGNADRASSIRFSADDPILWKPLSTLLPDGKTWTPTINEGETGRIAEPWYAYGFLNSLQTASVPAHRAVPMTFAADGGSGPSVRITLLPEGKGQLVNGKNSSIRLAAEDDAKLNQFQRPFVMLRHIASNELASPIHSRFISVIEPFMAEPRIASIERIAASGNYVVLKIGLPNRVDWIVFDPHHPDLQSPSQTADFQPTEVELGAVGSEKLRFSGAFGYVSIDLPSSGKEEKATIRFAYAAGAGGWTATTWKMPMRPASVGRLRAIEGQTLVVEPLEAVLPPMGSVLTLETDDGWTYPFTVVGARVIQGSQGATSTNRLRVEVQESLSMLWDDSKQQLKQISFPRRAHDGAIHVKWVQSSFREFR